MCAGRRDECACRAPDRRKNKKSRRDSLFKTLAPGVRRVYLNGPVFARALTTGIRSDYTLLPDADVSRSI